MTKARMYAEALCISAAHTPQQELSGLVSRFREALRRRGHEKLLPQIAREVERKAAVLKRRERTVLSVAHEEDVADARAKAASYMSEHERSYMQTVIDNTLIGGFTIETPARFIDNSYKEQLLALYRRMVER